MFCVLAVVDAVTVTFRGWWNVIHSLMSLVMSLSHGSCPSVVGYHPGSGGHGHVSVADGQATNTVVHSHTSNPPPPSTHTTGMDIINNTIAKVMRSETHAAHTEHLGGGDRHGGDRTSPGHRYGHSQPGVVSDTSSTDAVTSRQSVVESTSSQPYRNWKRDRYKMASPAKDERRAQPTAAAYQYKTSPTPTQYLTPDPTQSASSSQEPGVYPRSPQDPGRHSPHAAAAHSPRGSYLATPDLPTSSSGGSRQHSPKFGGQAISSSVTAPSPAADSVSDRTQGRKSPYGTGGRATAADEVLGGEQQTQVSSSNASSSRGPGPRPVPQADSATACDLADSPGSDQMVIDESGVDSSNNCLNASSSWGNHGNSSHHHHQSPVPGPCSTSQESAPAMAGHSPRPSDQGLNMLPADSSQQPSPSPRRGGGPEPDTAETSGVSSASSSSAAASRYTAQSQSSSRDSPGNHGNAHRTSADSSRDPSPGQLSPRGSRPSHHSPN